MAISLPPYSRFERQLVPSNILDRLQVISKSTLKANQKISIAETRRYRVAGTVPSDPRYDLELQFSNDDGATFTEPMINPAGDRIYQFRLRFRQHVDDRDLLAGVAIRWDLTGGWAFADGLPATLYDECISNPMVVTRAVRSPAAPLSAAFRLVVMAIYRG